MFVEFWIHAHNWWCRYLLGTETDSKSKVHLYLSIYMLYTKLKVMLYKFLNNFVHGSKLVDPELSDFWHWNHTNTQNFRFSSIQSWGFQIKDAPPMVCCYKWFSLSFTYHPYGTLLLLGFFGGVVSPGDWTEGLCRPDRPHPQLVLFGYYVCWKLFQVMMENTSHSTNTEPLLSPKRC